MELSTDTKGTGGVPAPLAGLQAGMVAALWMLAWLGSSAVWQGRSFWTAENLLASTFYGGSAIRSGFSHHTMSGLALYLIIYSMLGCLVAAVLRWKLHAWPLLMVSVVVALGWYYFSFHVIWKSVSPLIPLLHAERPTILGHVIYGAVLARFPRYLPRPAGRAAEPAAEAARNALELPAAESPGDSPVIDQVSAASPLPGEP